MKRLVQKPTAYRVVHTLDVDTIRKLDKACFRGEKLLSPHASQWWLVLNSRGLPVAYAGLEHFERNTAYLNRCGVLPEARGRDLQIRLIRIRLRWARKHGAGLAITYTSFSNIHSANNLIQCGFELYDPAYAWAGRNGVQYWRKPIA